LRLGQILINFCNNAVKFTEHGEIIVRTRVREEDDKGQLVCFSVSDTGIGLTEEQMGRLFQAFEQADASTTRQHGERGSASPSQKNWRNSWEAMLESVVNSERAAHFGLPLISQRAQLSQDVFPSPTCVAAEY
jgi:signal transduction histidine kinase